jgi:hypothetical protein
VALGRTAGRTEVTCTLSGMAYLSRGYAIVGGHPKHQNLLALWFNLFYFIYKKYVTMAHDLYVMVIVQMLQRVAIKSAKLRKDECAVGAPKAKAVR